MSLVRAEVVAQDGTKQGKLDDLPAFSAKRNSAGTAKLNNFFHRQCDRGSRHVSFTPLMRFIPPSFLETDWQCAKTLEHCCLQE